MVPQTRKDWSVVLPEEIKEHILKYALQLTDGIHDERWPMIKKILINSLSRKGLFHMVPKIFYSINSTVHLRFPHPKHAANDLYSISPTRSQPVDLGTEHLSPIRYPPPAFNQWVRELNIHIPLEFHGGNFPTEWIKKLASGELGFQGLEVLKFHTPVLPVGCYISSVRALRTGQIKFEVRKLCFFVEDHSCAWTECQRSGGGWACKTSRTLEKLLMAPGM